MGLLKIGKSAEDRPADVLETRLREGMTPPSLSPPHSC